MRLFAAFAAAVIGIAAVTVASMRSLSTRRESSGWVLHTQDLRVALTRILALATDAESAVRGYLLTGREEYLTPYGGADATAQEEAEKVTALTRDNPRQEQRAATLRSLLRTKSAALQRSIALRRSGDAAAATELVASGEAAELMRRLRTVVAEMSDEESSLLQARLAALARAEWWSAFVILGGAGLLLTFTIGGAALVRADLRLREEQADERARVLEYQERLIGIVGHDLRNPLTALLVSAQMLAQKREEMRPVQASAVDRILRSAGRIDALANLLIDFTYARLGKGLPARPGPMDAKAVAERAVGPLREQNPGRDIRVDVAVQALPGVWDGDRIAQLVSILVSNAIQYGASDAPITVALSAPDDALQIRVQNSGPPVPADVRDKLFEPYTRGSGAVAAHPRGLGLGLFIAREIARAHGGTLEVRSDTPEGTVFTARLPRRPPAAGEGSSKKKAAEAPAT